MSTALTFLLLLGLIWIIFLCCKRVVNIILSWILAEVVRRVFPEEQLDITVDDYGYFSVKGVHVKLNQKPVVRISQVLLQFVWDDSIFGLKLQSTVTDLVLERSFENKSITQYDEDTVEIKGSLSLGINLFSLNGPFEPLKVAPERESYHGSDIETCDLTSLWLFAKNAEVWIEKKSKTNNYCHVFYKLSNNTSFINSFITYDGKEPRGFKITSEQRIAEKCPVSEGDALVRYNSKVARLVFLFNNASVTCSSTYVSQLQVATSKGLILMYKFVDGVLTSSHSRLKHTEIEMTPLALSTLETLISEYVEQDAHHRKNNASETADEMPQDENESCKEDQNQCEVAFEAEGITASIFCPEDLKNLELNVAVLGLGSPEQNKTRWSTSIPFEVIFYNADTEVKETVLGSKIKSEGLTNPCVLKAEGEESINHTAKWDVSFNEGILVQIKPEYLNLIESFVKKYKSASAKPGKHSPVSSPEVAEQSNISSTMDSEGDKQIDENVVKSEGETAFRRGIFEVSASICEIGVEVLDTYDQKLLQVTMMSPQLSLSQDMKTRSFHFAIGTLKAFNCLESIPFFHPTDDIDDEKESVASLALSVVEELSSDKNKLSYKKFTFGSCNTTVIAEETLIFAVMKHFGLHKKVAQIFFDSRKEESLEKTSGSAQRFYFNHLELRAVQIILTLLPAIDLPVDLKIVKNNLGIPHQLPPRVENASLNFDAFVRKNIQYGSYKYISNDIKKHYLKELGRQSARVLGSMHLLGNISRLKQDIISGFTTLRETGEFITFFRQVTTGVASSYSKFTGSWSDLFGYSNRYVPEPETLHERRHSDPSELDIAALLEVGGKFSNSFGQTSSSSGRSRHDSSMSDGAEDTSGIWFNSSALPDVASETDSLSWDADSSDGEGNLGIPLDLIPRNVERQFKGQEFLRRLKENLADNEHGEVFSCCFKIRKSHQQTKLNALLSNRKVFFLTGRPCHDSLVLCAKYETLYKAQYVYKDETHYLQLVNKMKGIKTLSIPSRNASENPLVRCDNMAIARKVAVKINELKKAYDHECFHSQQ